jgi:hypothetical protein
MILAIATTLSMLAIGYLAWKTIQKQESKDDGFEEKLRADEERARQGREAEARAHANRDKTK